MNASRAVNEFLSLSGNFLRSLRSVEFYQNDRWLTESISAFIKVGFVHETVVLISTAVHWTMFQDALSPDELEDERLVFLDARDLLA